jgi:hypothetical protein
MNRFGGLLLVCVVASFALGCEPAKTEVGAEGTTPPAVEKELKAYDQDAKNQTPNGQP